uniref:Uncharacterized protein n=1 Tax=Panagrolaimus superbus TaxID=310955 RepID=A0A914Z881_9BILA
MHFRRNFSAADYDKENEKFESENTLMKNYNEKLEQGIKNDRIIYEAERDGLNAIISTLKKENEDLIQTIKDKENEALQMIDNHNMQIRKCNDEMEDERKIVTNKINGFKSTINDLIKKVGVL